MNVYVTSIDGKDYMEVDKIEIKGVTYVYLSNVSNEEDFMIRKLSVVEGEVYYEALSGKEEFDNALVYFTKKHENLLRNE